MLKKLLRLLLLRDQPFTVKLLVYSALLVVVPMLTVGYFSYVRSSEVLEEEAKQSSLQIIQQVKTHVEYYVRDFEFSTLKIVNHPDTQKLMAMSTLEEIQQSGIRASIQQLLHNEAYSRGDITGITIILDDLQIIDTTGLNKSTPIDEIVKEYWYNDVPSDGSPILISRMIKLQDRNEPVISIVKRIISPRTLKPIGMIITDVNFKRLQEIADMVTIGRTGYMSILDTKGHYVYHHDLSLLGEPSGFKEIALFDDPPSGSYTIEKPNRELLTYSHSSALGWTLLTLVPYKELTRGVGYIGQTILWVTSITLIAAYLIGFTFASSLIRPIRNLQHYMKRIEIGDFNAKIKVESKDEIGLLSHGFNRMVVHLNQLIEEIYYSKLKESEMNLRQKETELRVLQSQINPHFLYNALETMRGIALEKDMDDLAEMSSSLSRLFRYNLKESSLTVTLKDEISVCELYLRIQQFRFEERLNYEFLLPNDLLNQTIVKFSLQPIIENCIHHAVEPGIKRTLITVSAFIENEQSCILQISDDGPGISPDALEHIRYDLKHKDITAGGSHIGLLNVHRRIEYLYGEGYGVQVDSRFGEGTTIKVRLPLGETPAPDPG
ncbi:sensor histidine kinase [Paenibacillus sedimenti]|uniref:histidine kinase n=1 Tax=Paenibacillus sedimenti TaxID=2770274 RepID=A0A926KM62_9BACL|nr:sensor histidine kinase [Paenibacillus sedimenti]MBD0379683.1 sensor histidine kinase [Paenibacillus sedimenti]